MMSVARLSPPSVVLLLLLGTGACALFFEDGFDHHYTYSSESDILGLHNITTIIKFRIRRVNETATDGVQHQLMMDSFVQHSEKGYVVDNALMWNLNHKFYFTVARDGLVTLVHHHPEEKYEMLTLKKVLASTLSAKVKIANDTSWTFKSEEEDHAGQLVHDYHGERYSDGIKLVRSHQSSSDVHRYHNKTLHLDLKGTVLHVDSLDNITLRSEPSKASRIPMEGEQEILEDESGEFPKIASISRSKLKLTVKRRHYESTTHALHELQQDAIIVKPKPDEKNSLQKVEADIALYLSCVRAIPNKYDRNRTECVHNLRNLIHSLKKEDFVKLGTDALTRKCQVNDTVCVETRNLFIDIIAREGSAEAQLMVLNIIMRSPNVTEDDLRRCLFHSIAWSTPELELVRHIEELCFEGGVTPGETPSLTKTRKRACLSLGAMAKSLHDKNTTESDRITEQLENWLDHHNQTKSMKIIKPRKRRSIIQYDIPARKHVETKMVLIQSLGNAGKLRSLNHIKSYLEPNAGVTAWRRAAIHSLRHFSCHESAHALVSSAVHDDNEVVRKIAVKVLAKHPMNGNFTVDHENVVLSKNYTYPVVTRVKRSLLQTLEQGISFQIKPPGIEWEKVLGNNKIGASFGLEIRNILDLQLALLSGHFSIDVYDGAFAEAHVGMVGFKVDIVKAYVCFKGHIEYDLNVLKDFGINSLQDLVHIYDKIVAKIVTPITDAVNNFRKIITLLKHRSLTDIVNTLVTTVKNLPHIMGEVTQRLSDFIEEIYSIAGSTIMEEIKVIVQHVRQFVDGIKQDIMKFYNDIVDAVTMALPFITKKITEAFNLVVGALKELINNPIQSITAMSRAINDIKMAITMVVDVKTKIIDACLFIKGRAVAWLNTAKEIPQVLKRLAEAFKKLVSSIRKRRDLQGDMTSVFNNGVDQMKDSLHSLESDLKAKWDKVFAPLRPLMNIVQPFVDEFKSIMDAISGIKWAYKTLKDVFQTSKALVQKVFGPKFHRDFPTQRRDAKGKCKSGVWPTTTDGQYSTTGVDVKLGVGQSIKNPVNGIVYVRSKNKVVIQPTDPEFSVMEIVIENINILPNINGKNMKSGEKIGRASKAPKCKQNFIHVSVRQAQEGKIKDDADYEYTDPSTFLDRLVPIPKWIQDCNDHEFRYIGQTTDSGESTEDGEPESEKEALARNSEEADDKLDDMLGEEDPEYRPEDSSLYDQTSFGDSLKDSLKKEAKKFAEFFKSALFGKDGPKVPDILGIVNVNGKSVKWVLNKLSKSSKLFKDFGGVVGKLSSSMTALPKGNPAAMSLTYVKKLLKLKGLSAKVGDVSHMSDTLMNMAGKLCPMFKGAIAAGFGHVCTVEDDCLGISCSVPLPVGAKTKHVELGVSVKPSEMKVVVTVNGKQLDILTNGIDVELDLKLSFFGMKLYMIANCELKKGSLVLSAEVKLCAKLFSTCLPSIELFHEIKFSTPAFIGRRKRATTPEELTSGLQDMGVSSFICQLADYQLLHPDITKVLEDVRETVVKELMTEQSDQLGEVKKEMQDKVDFCISANIPVPPFDIAFFNLRYHFMVGPVPLSLGFGAAGAVGLGVKVGLCVLSMTTQITLTPWVGGKVWGDAAVDIGFARGGIRLIGYLLETKFPILTELVFSKYPLDVGSRMDLELTPLRLVLKAFAELKMIFTTVTVFEGTLWKYSVPKIKQNIFNKKKRDDDPSPPNIMPATINERRKRSGARGCIVKQIPNRRHYDTAFSLEMYAQDEVSDTKLFYAIGTHRGGTNLVDWTEMGGPTLMVPAKLPGGIPIYWTVKARNSQGLEAITQCWLNTFDSTLPDGRVEHAYAFSSHPSKLLASVVAFEDSPLEESHSRAVGFSPGQFGSQFVDWEELRLDHSISRIGVSGALKHFTVPREGMLVAWILKTQKTHSAGDCAEKCIAYGFNCVSFDYEYHSETCDFHDVVQGANAYLRISGTNSNYERLGSGYHTPLEYTNLPLTHGSTYFVNTRIRNVLGYDAYLVGEGTMVDFTPPEPGLIRNAAKDILRADNCTAAITQQCIDVTWKENHRVIIDGVGSGTVFNGHEPLFDELYTLTNHYVSTNWKGFHDDESGIWGNTWAVGTDICATDVIAFEDPYAHLTSKKFWTDSAFHKGIHLDDGRYYVTVQALNGAGLGGSLVTTVCHSTPFVVDTTPPVFDSVTDIIYDEDFDLIAIYYDAHDDLSKIAKAEFGLGKTKYDVDLKSYSLHASMERDDPFVAVEDLGLREGIPAWIRIRVTNNVELFTSGHGDEPILIDKSPPIPGNVLDGDRLQQDRTFQSDDKHICAQWVDFYDPESGIDRFIWGVGTRPGVDDVVKYRNLTHYDKSGCAAAALEHNHKYYSTVFSYNNALNSKASNSSSDGVLVDTSSPIAGYVSDGKTGDAEMIYSSETVSKFANWHGYHDPESGIAKYEVGVYVNNEHKKTFDVGEKTQFEDHTISMEHQDKVYFTVHGVNGADLDITANSNGFLVDLTPPIMTDLSDNKDGAIYQSENKNMNLRWDFHDSESGIKEYRTVIYETKYGVKQKFWPFVDHYNVTLPPSPYSGRITAAVDALSLQDGALYTLHVTAMNGALLSTSHESTGVTIDTSPPAKPTVKIGLPKDEEEIDENKHVVHDDQTGIRISWSARDSESGIKRYLVAIGTVNDPETIYSYNDFGEDTTAYIQNIHFEAYLESSMLYVVSIKAINGAGLLSPVGKSKQILVQKANVPGIVFDGRDLYKDAMYTIDHTSVAASFYGFESESCNIISYEWAIGTTEYGTDVLSYTNYGVVMHNDTHGQCQIHTELYEDTTYYVTVRAVTGCRETYILSTSDGITVDRNPPEIIYEQESNNDTSITSLNGVIYQSAIDSLAIMTNVTDRNSVAATRWALGSLPLLDDRHSFTDDITSLTNIISLIPGEATFITTNTSDKAGNVNMSSSMAIISDITAPLVEHLDCTNYISIRKSLVKCTWEMVTEHESLIKEVKISMGTNSDASNIINSYIIPKGIRYFTRDLNKHLKSSTNISSIYIKVVVNNVVDQSKDYGRQIIVDTTPPVHGTVAVVTSVTQSPNKIHQRCQQPKSYVELRVVGADDYESGIDYDRFEISLGNKPYGIDIKNYVPVQQMKDGTIFVDGFTLTTGSLFYATVRIHNQAGLYTDVTSESVVVSQSPYLEVIDGDSDEDIDYQSVPNLIQGRWEYSDTCPIREAYWSMQDLTGKILFDFQPIPSVARKFFNDEVALENGMKYITTVKTIDFLNRTKIARSDGLTIRIQPPYPGHVRDGLDKDINYQFSTTDLSANWDNFGDNSKDPTQSIEHYEIAIGNDRRYAKTRSNVHFFVNVGLNTSYTFRNLNLTSKLIRYYITVRSYSIAGGYSEGYTNGVRVGYSDDIVPGYLTVNKFQSSTETIAVSWTGFRSDIDIILYKVGVSSHEPLFTNDTLSCIEFEKNKTMFDTNNLHNVGLNEYVKLDGLSLIHGASYYVTVMAEDEAGMCTAVTSHRVLVDTTPPNKGNLYINNMESDTVLFAISGSRVHVHWQHYNDTESGIKQTKVTLLECKSCYKQIDTISDCFELATNDVEDDDKSSFYELQMTSSNSYFVLIEVMNNAQLTRKTISSTILLDTSSPFSGQVKVSNDWYSHRSFQHSTSRIRGQLAIANTYEDYICPSQTKFFPKPGRTIWPTLSSEFSDEFTVMNKTGAYLGIGYNADLSDITKSGIVSKPMKLNRGNYSFVVKIARGENIVTSFTFQSDVSAIPFTVNEKPIEAVFDERAFENITGLSAPENDTNDMNTSSTTTTQKPGSFVPINDSDASGKTYLNTDEYGFGIHFLGYKFGENKDWHSVLWARNKFTSIERWFRLRFDPTMDLHKYTIQVERQTSNLQSHIELTLIVDNEEYINIAGFKFNADVKLSFMTWNEDNYKPPIEDIYRPFYSDASLTEIDIPDKRDKLCRHGRGFYDGESGIKDIWLGLSDNKNEVGNISPLKLYKSFCFPCIKPCNELCKEPCSDERLTDGFNLVPLDIQGLNLESSDADDICLNATNDIQCNSSYYLNVKLTNFAGEETIEYSDAIQVDITPPACEYVKCLDPDYSKDEPTGHIGSSSTIGAYWNCTEDISQIQHYSVKVLRFHNNQEIMGSTSVGLKSKVRFNLGNDTFKDGEDYLVEVSAVNTAGLNVTGRCSVHVNLYPPDVSGASSHPLYTFQTSGDDEDEPEFTDSQARVGISWQDGTNDTEFYEWQIGTTEDSQDVFPAVKVGQNISGSAAIVHGKLEFNSKTINRTVSDFRDTGNMTVEQIQNRTLVSERERAFFSMEPGRCIHQSLYAIGYSHLKNKIRGKTVCIRRNESDVYINQAKSHRSVVYKAKASNKWHRVGTPTPEIVVDATLLTGGLSVGTLTASDKTVDYGSAASADYKPYITDPNLTQGQSSRQLRKRIQKWCNISFYISPAPRADYSQILVNVSLPAGCKGDNISQPALIYWDNTDVGQWKHIDEGCFDYLTAQIDGNNNVYFSNICSDLPRNSSRTKRSDESSLLHPRAFELTLITRSFTNNAPTITTDTVQLTEDHVTEVMIQTHDADDDELLFQITRQPEHMSCTIHVKDGKLNCTLEEDFYGMDFITIKVTETGESRPPLEACLTAERKIRLGVTSVPDKTDRFYIAPDGHIHRNKRPSLQHSITSEANRTSNMFAGTILLADVDGGEVFSTLPRFSALGNATYTLTQIDVNDIPNVKMKSTRYRTLKAYSINVQFSSELNGNMTFEFIAKTADGKVTPSVKLDIFILANPCVSGHCNPGTPDAPRCNDVKRASSFSEYVCICQPGYEGEWCEIETNECQWEPCALMFDCEDLIDDYSCNINIPKLMAILICSIIAVVGMGFLLNGLSKRYRKYKHNKVGQSKASLMADNFRQTYCVDENRPTSSGSVFIEAASNGEAPLSTSKRLGDSTDDIGLDFFTFTKAAGMQHPPHHRNLKPKFQPNSIFSNMKPKVPKKKVSEAEDRASKVSRENLEQILAGCLQSEHAQHPLDRKSDKSDRCPSAMSGGSVVSEVSLTHLSRMTDIDV